MNPKELQDSGRGSRVCMLPTSMKKSDIRTLRNPGFEEAVGGSTCRGKTIKEGDILYTVKESNNGRERGNVWIIGEVAGITQLDKASLKLVVYVPPPSCAIEREGINFSLFVADSCTWEKEINY